MADLTVPCLIFLAKMFVGDGDSVYILDKSEGNAETINGHPAMGARWSVRF